MNKLKNILGVLDFRDEKEIAVQITDRIITMQECDGGYDYTIYDKNLHEIDGGVYDDTQPTIGMALLEVIKDLLTAAYTSFRGSVELTSSVMCLDYEDTVEQAEKVSQKQLPQQDMKWRFTIRDLFLEMSGIFTGRTMEEAEKVCRETYAQDLDCFPEDVEIVRVEEVG